MSAATITPYGSWKSPITSDLIVQGSIRLGDICLDGADIYWSEMRPMEAGRTVVVRRTPDGQTIDLTPPEFNVRTRVHEYGGISFTVADRVLYFSNFADQRLYRQSLDGVPTPITPEGAFRYADVVVDQGRDRLIGVREDHSGGGHEPVNTIVAIDASGDEAGGTILISGCDFYAAPRLSPAGDRLAWLSWNHPNMPWDAAELWVADVNADGLLAQPQKIAGGATEAIFQPEWAADGSLYFVGDRTGWWNLYRWHANTVEPLCPKEAEFGLPLWVFGMTTYGMESNHTLICTYIEAGIQHLARLNTQTLALDPIAIPYSSISGIQVGNGKMVFKGGSAIAPGVLALLDLATGDTEVLRHSSEVTVDPGYLSIPEVVEFPTDNGVTAFAFYYPPKNKDVVAPTHERPPLLVKSHGGPTAATSATFSLGIQYWTSRGIAVLDVNYGGSTGYGRAYRERLRGQWGIVDVNDCMNAAKYLVEQGLADGDRLCIDGGSAGGYTTLAALTFHDTFKAGASYYGVSDLVALAKDTHKFEARYLDGLIGPYPEREDLYQERSPIHFIERLSCPVIFFQGDEDKIVPPNQAEMMADALKAKGLPVAYVLFEGEQHGFRKAENIKRSLDAELYFYSKVFGFELADPIEPIVIDNLSTL